MGGYMRGRMRDWAFFAGGAIFATLVGAIVYEVFEKPATKTVVANARAQTIKSIHAAKLQTDFCSRLPSLTPRDELLKFLRRTDLDKGEFETSAEYTKRMTQALGALQTVTVSMPIPEYNATYDADRGRLAIDLSTMFDLVFSDAEPTTIYHGIVLSKSETDGGSYLGQNAFGASRDIHVTNKESEEVAMKTSDATAVGGKVWLQTDPATAKAFKSNLCIVISGNPSPPLKLDYTNRPTPTIDNPYVENSHTLALIIKPLFGKIVDARSNKAVASFNPTTLQ